MSASTESLARRAIDLLDAALGKPPGELTAEVDEAERAVVAVRDDLIEHLRRKHASGPPRPDDAVRRALGRANVALSLVVGVEYPVGGLQRGLLEQARATLAELVEAATTLL